MLPGTCGPEGRIDAANKRGITIRSAVTGVNPTPGRLLYYCGQSTHLLVSLSFGSFPSGGRARVILVLRNLFHVCELFEAG